MQTSTLKSQLITSQSEDTRRVLKRFKTTMDPKEIRDFGQLSPETIKHLSDHELLAQWYLTMYKFHLYCDLRDQCKEDHEFSALVQPLMLLNAERDLILHEIERRDMVLEKRTDIHLMNFSVN